MAPIRGRLRSACCWRIHTIARRAHDPGTVSTDPDLTTEDEPATIRWVALDKSMFFVTVTGSGNRLLGPCCLGSSAKHGAADVLEEAATTTLGATRMAVPPYHVGH